MKALLLVLACLLCAQVVSAQVGTEPLAWEPARRPLADALGTAAVYGQIGAATWTAWKAEDRKRAFIREGCALGVAVGLSQALKLAIREDRPNGVDRQSFPSMHSAAATAVSGWSFTFGVPVAAFTGLSRSAANWHHLWPDVAAGWAIGALAQAVCR